MTTIKSSATEGVRTLDVIVRDDGLVNLSIGQVGSSCGIQIRKYELLEALDAVAKASPWGELQEDYGRVVRELREARAKLAEAEATIERVRDVMNEFYKVRGDWHSWTGANALKASLESALDPKPAFELPTEAGSLILLDGKPLSLNADGWWMDLEGGPFTADFIMSREWRLAKVVEA